ncbi:aspartate kinase [Senegalia massiliensis]|uniref:Aspartokinase n=1 Tax=Senegalia massiliensis TaxID=1720316 RepID=A0A845QXW7_9CLOT|nr:aspartate kinase [Senegalia massiliensis]NBI06844.1 aspartate kinase [Senegalia massiliensis]
MNIIVQKYGGTSLKDIYSKKSFLSHVKKCISNNNKLVIVVSAIGRKGDSYATDTLINQLEKINKNINPKIKDLIMSCGEIISASIISHLLETENVDCEVLTGYQAGILTDDNFTKSKIIDIDTTKIKKYLNKNKVVVVAGFQGKTKNNEITTLGRGGSDTTAVALGAYLNAKRVDIFTDVDGVAFIDPNLIKNTKYIEKISYNNMYKLASNGACVVHPRAVMIGEKYNIPIRVCSIFSNTLGTLITNYNDNNMKKVIGIAVRNEENRSFISILFSEEYKAEITKNICDYLNSNKKEKEELQVICDNEKITFIVENKNLDYHINNLYKIFIT